MAKDHPQPLIVELRPSFEADLKQRGINKNERIELLDFYDALMAGPLPAHYQDHELMQDWAGYRECHLAEDWLVIYKRSVDRIILSRTGTHKDLFTHVRKR